MVSSLVFSGFFTAFCFFQSLGFEILLLAAAPAKLWSFCRRMEPWLSQRHWGMLEMETGCTVGRFVCSVLLSGTSNPGACRALRNIR